MSCDACSFPYSLCQCCHVCGSIGDIDHGAERMGAVEFPENICEGCYRDREQRRCAGTISDAERRFYSGERAYTCHGCGADLTRGGKHVCPDALRVPEKPRTEFVQRWDGLSGYWVYCPIVSGKAWEPMLKTYTGVQPTERRS